VLNILLLTDTKSGHETVSKGFLEILQNHYVLEINTIVTKLTLSALRPFLKHTINCFPKMPHWLIKGFLQLFYRIKINQLQRPDIVVSTGGNTSFANILLTRYFGCKNIYLSSLRGLNPNNFTLIYSIVDNNISNEVVLETAPVSIGTKLETIQNLKLKYGIDESLNVWSVLIGGDSNEYKYTPEEYKNLMESIIILAKKHNAKLLITTSRRTPKDVEKEIHKLSQGEQIILKFVMYNQKPEKLMGFFISSSSIVFCTEDSSSMITEVVQSYKPLYTLYPKKRVYNEKYNAFINNMLNLQYIHSIPISEISKINTKEYFKSFNNSTESRILESITPIVKECKNQKQYFK
jgi:hypothetical protein